MKRRKFIQVALVAAPALATSATAGIRLFGTPGSVEPTANAVAALGDKLVVRSGYGVEPTPRALALLRQLEKDTSLPDGSKFETFAWADFLLGLDLVRQVGQVVQPIGRDFQPRGRRGVQHLGALGPRRVWLHTCSKDGPYAMDNYLRRGFRLFDTKTELEPDVATPGPWPGAERDHRPIG